VRLDTSTRAGKAEDLLAALTVRRDAVGRWEFRPTSTERPLMNRRLFGGTRVEHRKQRRNAVIGRTIAVRAYVVVDEVRSGEPASERVVRSDFGVTERQQADHRLAHAFGRTVGVDQIAVGGPERLPGEL
jgi:hypothetical protein